MTIYERLSAICKREGLTITALCVQVTGNKGNLQTWKNNKGHMRSEYLSKCADVLGCSTDYILGRVENNNPANSNNTISGNNNIIGNHNSQTITADKLSAQEQQLLTYFRNLGEVDKAKTLLYAAEISEKKQIV